MFGGGGQCEQVQLWGRELYGLDLHDNGNRSVVV